MVERLWQDVRYAARSLRRAPAFTAAAVVTEIALRAAIGASRAQLVRHTMVEEVSGTDTATLTLVPGLLVGVAFLACYVPARRAARTDPMLSLRAQ
ncbi:MAG: hypothetical protein GEV06_14790 [Luteitalea sp.]|nr:hypothetical protein [Luteitalea sp.]